MSTVTEILKSYNLSEYSMMRVNSPYQYHMMMNEVTDEELYIKCRGLIYSKSDFLWQRKFDIMREKIIINMFFANQDDLITFKMMS